MNDIVDVIIMIKELFVKNNNKVPTIALFCQEYNLNAASIIRKFGAWNSLLDKANLKLNKSSKRTEEQLLLWLKTHPNAKYNEIPKGIRSSLEDRFGTISKARNEAGLKVLDWRLLAKKRNKKNINAGRPIEYTADFILNGLVELAVKLGRPPRLKDINKKSCGFPVSAIISRFGTFNVALQKASLPPVYSYHEYNKLEQDLEILLFNIKLELNDIPKFYKLESGQNKPIFIYDNRLEYVKLSRSDIQNSGNLSEIATTTPQQQKQLIIFYLVDDSLYDNKNIKMICINELIPKIKNEDIINKIKQLRIKYDDVSRKYIWERAQLVANKY